MREMQLFTFTDEELEDARQVAERRYEHKRRHGIRIPRIDRLQSDFEMIHVGVLGEIAIARRCGVDIDRELYLYTDGGVDLVVNGCKVQVKKNMNRGTPHLYFNRLEEFVADVAVLLVKDPPRTVYIAGSIGRARFERESHVRDFGYGPRVVMPWYQLDDFDSLIAYLEAADSMV